MAMTLYIATWMTPATTLAAQNIGIAFPEGAVQISSMNPSGSPFMALSALAAKMGWAGFGILFVAAIAMAFAVSRYVKKQNLAEANKE